MEQGASQIPALQPSSLKSNILKQFPKGPNKGNLILVLGSLLVVILGVASGWILSGGSVGARKTQTQQLPEGVKQTETEAGITDESAFSERQSPEGVLREGGIEGEGTHYLERAGGASQNVYLTSTFIDLQPFVGKKVKVWGETLSAVHAGWLMDVGKIKVIE